MLGGGGHDCAAGFSLEGPQDSAMATVLNELRMRMQQSI